MELNGNKNPINVTVHKDLMLIHNHKDNMEDCERTCGTCENRLGEECDGKYEGKEVYDDDYACDEWEGPEVTTNT
jgi:hypothetical protein